MCSYVVSIYLGEIAHSQSSMPRATYLMQNVLQHGCLSDREHLSKMPLFCDCPVDCDGIALEHVARRLYLFVYVWPLASEVFNFITGEINPKNWNCTL